MKELCPTAPFTALYYCLALSKGGDRNWFSFVTYQIYSKKHANRLLHFNRQYV